MIIYRLHISFADMLLHFSLYYVSLYLFGNTKQKVVDVEEAEEEEE